MRPQSASGSVGLLDLLDFASSPSRRPPTQDHPPRVHRLEDPPHQPPLDQQAPETADRRVVRRPVGKAQTHEATPRKVVVQPLLQLRIAEVGRCCRSIAFSITSGGYARRPSREECSSPTIAPIRSQSIARSSRGARCAPDRRPRPRPRMSSRPSQDAWMLLLECFDPATRTLNHKSRGCANVPRWERARVRVNRPELAKTKMETSVNRNPPK